MSRSFLVDSLISNPHNGESSSPLSSPSSLPSSPGSPFPYPSLGRYLFSFGLQPPGFPNAPQQALSMFYPPYPLYGFDASDSSKLVRPIPLPIQRKPPFTAVRHKPYQKQKPTQLVIKSPQSPSDNSQGKFNCVDCKIITTVLCLLVLNDFFLYFSMIF